VQRDGLQAVFTGVRRDDPDGKKVAMFQPTGKGWPDAMRVFPILDWTYHEVWEYADAMKLPMCSLYARGYTSLGNRRNTRPHPLLVAQGRQAKHVRELKDDQRERAGAPPRGAEHKTTCNAYSR
jgi:FAD synthetase